MENGTTIGVRKNRRSVKPGKAGEERQMTGQQIKTGLLH
jgi:hypothetical protein